MTSVVSPLVAIGERLRGKAAGAAVGLLWLLVMVFGDSDRSALIGDVRCLFSLMRVEMVA